MSEFKPVKPEKSVISIRIDTDLLKKIDKLANDTDISRNEFILQCINFALKRCDIIFNYPQGVCLRFGYIV